MGYQSQQKLFRTFCTRKKHSNVNSQDPDRADQGAPGCPSGGKMREALWPGLWTECRAPKVHNPALVSGWPWSVRAPNSRQQFDRKSLQVSYLAWPTPVLIAGRFSTRVLWGLRIAMVQTGALLGPLLMVGKSQVGTVRGRGGFILPVPLKKLSYPHYLEERCSIQHLLQKWKKNLTNRRRLGLRLGLDTKSRKWHISERRGVW